MTAETLTLKFLHFSSPGKEGIALARLGAILWGPPVGPGQQPRGQGSRQEAPRSRAPPQVLGVAGNETGQPNTPTLSTRIVSATSLPWGICFKRPAGAGESAAEQEQEQEQEKFGMTQHE